MLLEIVTVRLSEGVSKALIDRIEDAFRDCIQDTPVQKIGILVDVETGCDLAVHMPTDSTDKSAAGLELASYLSKKGIVNHTVWIQRY